MVAVAIEAIKDRDAVEMRILTREQRRAAGRAHGIGDEAIGKARPAFGEPVQVRRLVHLRPIRRDGVLRVIVGEDEQYVRLV